MANLQMPGIKWSRISRSPTTSLSSPKFPMTDGIPVRNLETTRHGKGRLGMMSLPLEIKRILSRNPSRRLVGPRLFGTNLRPTRLLPKIILQSMRVQVQRTILLLRTTERTTRRTQSHLRELTHRSLDLTLDQAARVALEHILLTLMVSQLISTLIEAIKKAWNWFKRRRCPGQDWPEFWDILQAHHRLHGMERYQKQRLGHVD
jgi:hypothetical protein